MRVAFIAICLLAMILFIVERTDDPLLRDDGFESMYDSLWIVFWLITTLGYEGDFGSGSWESKLVYATAVIIGIGFTTMPMTIIGEAFASSWEEKEKLEVAVRMQELLFVRMRDRARDSLLCSSRVCC